MWTLTVDAINVKRRCIFLNKAKKSLATTKLDYDRKIAEDEAKAKALSQEEYYQMQQRMFNSDLDAWNRNMALEKEGKSSRLMDSRTGKAVEQPVFQRSYLDFFRF